MIKTFMVRGIVKGPGFLGWITLFLLISNGLLQAVIFCYKSIWAIYRIDQKNTKPLPDFQVMLDIHY